MENLSIDSRLSDLVDEIDETLALGRAMEMMAADLSDRGMKNALSTVAFRQWSQLGGISDRLGAIRSELRGEG